MAQRISRRKKSPQISDENVTLTCATPQPAEFHFVSKASFHFAIGLIALIVGFTLYGPALGGPFLFDDFGLPFYLPSFADNPIGTWLSGVRPILMLTYWMNFQLSAREPWTYHAVNVILHAVNSVLVFALLLRILRLRSIDPHRAILCAAVGCSIFLIHPLQTEAVAYIAGRSELICGFFSLAALVVFCRPGDLTVRRAFAVLALYCLAVLSKEQAVVLPGVFLVIDVVFRRRRLRDALIQAPWLYGPIAIVGVLATVAVLGLLARSSTAGFSVPGIQWYEYLFTQFRVWLIYLGLAILPFRQNADYDIAISRSLGDHGSAVALVILCLGALVIWLARKRLPMMFAGSLIFAIFLIPASSVIPLQDVAAERRMYLPLVGVLLILIQIIAKWRLSSIVTTGLVAYALTCCALTYERAKVWGSDIAFWEDTTKGSPGKSRGYTHLAYAYIRARKCTDAVKLTERAPEEARNTPELVGMQGHAYACEDRLKDAVEAFERAVLIGPGVGRYLALATSYRRVGRIPDAEAAEQQAMKLTPRTHYDVTMLEAFRGSSTQTRSRSARFGTLRSGQ